MLLDQWDQIRKRTARISSNRRRAAEFVTALVVVSVTAAGIGIGCASRSSSSSSSSSSHLESMALTARQARSSSPFAGLVQTVAYRHATLLYGRHDYTAAAATIDSLLADPQRLPAERTFLLHQKAICEQARLQLSQLSQLSQYSKSATSTRDASHPILPVNSIVDPADCGPRALLLVCELEHVRADLAHLRQVASTNAAKGGTSLEGLEHAARSVGFQAQGVQVDRDALANLSTPAIAWVDGNHYIAVLGIQRSLLGASHDTARIHDPNQTREEVIPLADLLGRSGGVLLTLAPTPHSH